MSTLENTHTVSHDLRILYVPTGIDWDTMWLHAVKLFKSGHTVQMHEHRVTERCPLLDEGSDLRRCGQLTDGPDGTRLVTARRTTNHDN